MTERHLVLNGFMATGKSTIGPMVAHRLNIPFIDLDDAIVAAAGLDVAGIFAQRGEAEFRRLEGECLKDALNGPRAVIAGGAGFLESIKHQRRTEQSAVVITLECTIEESACRIMADGPNLRPVGARKMHEGGIESLRDLKALRASSYVVYPQISTQDRSPEEAAGAVLARYQELAPFEGSAYELRFPGGPTSLITIGEALPAESGPRLTDDTVARLHPEFTSDAMTIPAGESAKTLETATRIYRRLQHVKVDRDATLTAIGGGVVCDIAGFVASTYLRGINLRFIPTTLLAQVDAAIGGKTGVDLDGAKNAVGTVHPAGHVMIDHRFLKTLPLACLQDGLAEMVKIAVIHDAHLFELLDTLADPSLIADRVDLIRHAIRNKVDVVAGDPYERTGRRAMLNFGHTVGHAIEAAGGYTLSHGRCVAIGMAVETRIAVTLELIAQSDAELLYMILARLGLPTEPPRLDIEIVLEAMLNDKKRTQGITRMALPTGIGSGQLVEVAIDDIRAALR